MVKFLGSVATLVQETTLSPALLKPPVAVGAVMVYAKAEAAKARTVAKARMIDEVEKY